MEEQTETIEIKPKNTFAAICTVQAVCVAVILIAVLVIKFFFADCYAKLSDWCVSHFLEETVITDVFDEVEKSEV